MGRSALGHVLADCLEGDIQIQEDVQTYWQIQHWAHLKEVTYQESLYTFFSRLPRKLANKVLTAKKVLLQLSQRKSFLSLFLMSIGVRKTE